jgi:hypothetical protein
LRSTEFQFRPCCKTFSFSCRYGQALGEGAVALGSIAQISASLHM